MIEVVKIFFVLAVTTLLILRRVRVELTLFFSAVLLGLVFGLNPFEVSHIVGYAFIDPASIELALIIILISFLGVLLKATESLANIVSASNNLFGDVRVALMGIPAFIGFLPMPGGALVSAPFVSEVSEKLKISPEQKTLVNYWFRHVWEYSFPLYPGIIFAAALVELPYEKLVIHQAPLSLAAIFFGLIFITRGIHGGKIKVGRKTIWRDIRVLLVDVWPVALVIVTSIVLKVDLIISLTAAIILFSISRKMPLRGIRNHFREVHSMKLFTLVVAVMAFKGVVESSGAADSLPETFTSLGIPETAIVYLIPFIVGLLTGYSYAAVGISFPIIMAYLVPGTVNLDMILLAYTGGLMGLLLSPVHLCLVLTRDYFKADLFKTYISLLPLIISMSITALLLVRV